MANTQCLKALQALYSCVYQDSYPTKHGQTFQSTYHIEGHISEAMDQAEAVLEEEGLL